MELDEVVPDEGDGERMPVAMRPMPKNPRSTLSHWKRLAPMIPSTRLRRLNDGAQRVLCHG